ncbi:Kinetochore protein spc7 [Wickerhamomyces ciferrii]|uniref:Kinetochore protein spc7 n=1 Tax=Wickerhamomyces ciferrii (strain ATCC 14091 / BCRC 22168 / CBS 111 / JCM 3599 / NBRC 0793 / NRRL Y-1031 F-60-10) TaxID=1206466 RepID=K0KPD3_WICCF|nr:Kinetochore protein spc7 [Wickerhamomyces ciferrii]CCH44047.1 Kinetochore protein spc7 [Wickerhamomyces ciferrii]
MSDEESIKTTTLKDTECVAPKEASNTNPTSTINSLDSGVSVVIKNDNIVEDPAAASYQKSISQAQANKKKDLTRPLFSRSSTNDKAVKNPATNKSMIVETETVDASKVPSVTLPIASTSNVINNELMSNNSSISNNLASLRSKKSTLFIDQNNQTTQIAPNTSQNLNAQDDNDTISVNGSIRNISKRLNPSESHMNISKPGATKADLFAARIANAVGDVSDSDSEETFVYESAPDAMNTSNTLPANKNSTIAGVLSSSNPMALRKLSQRNISMPVTPSQPYSPTASHIMLTNDDSKEANDKQYDTEEDLDLSNKDNTITNSNAVSACSPTDDVKDTADVIEDNGAVQSESSNEVTKVPSPNITQISKPPENVVSKSFTKYNGGNNSRKPSSASLLSDKKQNQLRTTTSKLFETKGTSLRRYSGVPDDINIEDYIDQYDEEQEIDGADYADTYEYDDYEDEDELTPLNVHVANGNLRYNASKGSYNKRKFPNFKSTDQGGFSQEFGDYKDGSPLRHTNSRILRNPKKNRKPQNQRHYSPHNFYNSKRSSKLQILKNFFYFFVLVLLLLVFGFIAGFLLATTKDLQDVDILSIDDVIVSYDELVFDLQVQAFNPGFITVEVVDLEMDVFAKSSHLNDGEYYIPSYLDDSKSLQTILLGSVSKFETPLEFPGGFFNRNHTISIAGVKLIHPGKNSTDNNNGDSNHKIDNDSDKWRTIIDYPFDLIVRGSLQYTLPFFHTDRSVAVTKTVSIDVNENKKSKSGVI